MKNEWVKSGRTAFFLSGFHSALHLIARCKRPISIGYLVFIQSCIFLPAVSGQEASGIRPMKIKTVKRL